jgi:predicted Zn finger-like uncharacterized protein
MLTRCPQCQTMFRILPEHLKVRQGRVRCGRCRAEFNALETLIEDPPPPPPLPVVSSETSAPGGIWFSQRDDGLAAADATDGEAPLHFETADLPRLPDEPKAADFAAEPPPEEEDDSPVTIPLTLPPDDDVPAAATAPGEIAETTAEGDAEPSSRPGAAAEARPAFVVPPLFQKPAAHAEPPAAEMSEQEAIAARGPFTLIEEVQEELPPPRRWPWIVLTVFALVALALQATLHFRVDLASRLPAVRPVLTMLCDVLACNIPLPMDIAAIGIDTSDLHPDPVQADRLQLLATLRNRSPYAQTWPHLEVTLTDANDKVLLRRAVTPAEYLAERKMLAAGFAARSEQALKLDLKVIDLAPVGYRLYVFYP